MIFGFTSRFAASQALIKRNSVLSEVSAVSQVSVVLDIVSGRYSLELGGDGCFDNFGSFCVAMRFCVAQHYRKRVGQKNTGNYFILNRLMRVKVTAYQ